MALGIYFRGPDMSADKYDEVQRRLQEAGQGSPAGRMYHCTFKVGEGLNVFDVWDSQESFDTFGQTLMPILAETGINMPEPEIAEVYKIIEG